MQNNPNLGYVACVNPNFIIHTPALKIVADGGSGVVSGIIKFPFSIYNEKLQKGAIIPRAQRVENKLEETSAFKTSTKARVIFANEKKHQRKHVRTKLTQTAQSLSYAMSQVPNSASYTYLLMTCKRFRANVAQTFDFVSLGT